MNKHQVTSEEEEELELGDEDEDDVNEDESVVVEEDERLIQVSCKPDGPHLQSGMALKWLRTTSHQSQQIAPSTPHYSHP